MTPKRDRMGSLLPMTVPLVLVNVASVLLIYMADIDNPRFFASILVPLGRYSIFIRLLLEILLFLQVYFVLVTFWILFFAVSSTVINHWIRAIRFERHRFFKHRSKNFWIILLIILIKCITGWCRRNAWSSEFHSNPQSKQLKKNLRTYRQLQVLTGLYNNCLSALVWPSFILCNLSCHGLSIYITVKLLGEVFPVIAVLFTFWTGFWFIIDFTIFPHMGQMKELSIDYLHHLKVARICKLDQKIAASLQPLGVKVGNFFTMGKITVLTIIVIVSNLTINALLII